MDWMVWRHKGRPGTNLGAVDWLLGGRVHHGGCCRASQQIDEAPGVERRMNPAIIFTSQPAHSTDT